MALSRWSPVVCVLAAASCASGGASERPATSSDAEATRSLSEDLFPFSARSAEFALARGERRTLRVEPSEGGAVMWFEGPGAAAARMDVRREGTALVFSGGPDATTELLRLGAAPGSEWPSGDATVRFDGWERLTLSPGAYDAARIRVTTGEPPLQVVQTWWFAPGAGLIRLRSDRGGIFADEMSLSAAPR